MTALERLGRVLLVGVARSPLGGAQELEPYLDRALQRRAPDLSGEADALLDSLALARGAQLGGERLAPGAQVLPPAPPEERDEAPSAAGRLLPALLRPGREQALLPDWLERCAQGGFRLPPAQLPRALELGLGDVGLRQLILPVIGARGAWLAQLRPRWSFAVSPDTEEAWAHLEAVFREAAEPRVRRSAFEGLRSGDPARALALARELWGEMGAREKVAVLDTLSPLRREDEGLLERARQDSAKTVRGAATDLLARLPGSSLLLRMETRLQDILRIKDGTVIVEAPRRLDPDVEADGVVRDPPTTPHGKRHAWVEQMIAMVPPERWSVWFEAPPEALVALLDRSSTAAGLRLAFTAATLRHRDPRWAKVLLERGAPAEMKLAALLGPGEAERHLEKRISSAASVERLSAWMGYLPDLPRPISARFARVALEAMDWLARSRAAWGVPAFGALRRLALDAELDSSQGAALEGALHNFAAQLPVGSPWRSAVAEALALTERRRQIALAFDP
ncbi:MAG: DUF5691 domain-containing protein [Myxococcota bacterium]